MNNFQIVSDKLTVPALPTVCIQRHELLNTFQEEVNKRVIFVSAPAGYSKSVSTLLYLYRSEHVPIWIGLDAYDNTPSIFYKLLCAGILSVQPDSKIMADILRGPSFASYPVEDTIRLLAEFVPDEKRYALVLDDAHLLTNEELMSSLLLVQKRLPLSFVTLILTRDVVKEEYLEIIGREKTSIITTEQLAFSPKEIEAYFSEHKRPITKKEAMAIHHATQGWAIGIHSLAMSGQIELNQNNSHMVENYIKKHIWAQHEASLQDFLLKTAVVDEMTSELCNKLTGRTDSASVLKELCQSKAFIRRVSESVYQYDHLLINFLRKMLKQDKHIDTYQLYQHAAEWFFEQSDYLRATSYYVQSGNQDGVTECLKRLQICELHSNIEAQFVFMKEHIFPKNPDAFIGENFELTQMLALTCFWDGNSKDFIYYADILYDHISTGMRMTHSKRRENKLFLEVLDFRVPLHVFFRERGKKLPIHTLSGKQESKRNLTSSLIQNFPLMHRSIRDYSEVAIHTKEYMSMLDATFGLVIGEEYHVLKECLQAGLCYEKNRLPTALAHGISALKKCEKVFSIEVKFCVYMILTIILSAMGKVKEAVSKVTEIESFIEDSNAQYLLPNLLSCTIKIKLWRGDQVIAKQWLDQHFMIKKTDLEFYKIFQHFTTARAYLVLGQTDLAMEYILKLKQLGIDYRRPLDIAEASVLQAALEWTLGHKQDAQDTLEEVLISVQKYKLIRVVANEGAAVLPILKKLRLKPKKKCSKSTLSSRFLQEVTIAAYEQSKRYRGVTANIKSKKPIKLSKQQKRMITLLSQGYKHIEIAEITGITIHTVKSHCSAAYRKLGVHNAMDAVIKARELGLIE